jgi:outer membrane protein assembly factor BamB
LKMRWKIGRIVLLLALVVVLSLVGLSCVRGLAPIGWSGGAVSDGTLYVGSREGRLVAVDLADDSRLWSDSLRPVSQPGFLGCSPATGGGGCGAASAGVAIYGKPVVYADKVYLAGYNGKVNSYFADTLQIDEEYPVGSNLGAVVGGLVVADGNLYFGCSDGNVYALDAEKLKEKWTAPFATGDKIWATPAIDGDTLYIGSFDKKLYALNVDDGSKKWEFATEGAIIATPLVYRDTVYIGSLDRNLYALNASDGRLKWRFTGENWFWAEPVVYNDMLYVGCLDGFIYVLKASDGARVAEYDLTHAISSQPVVVDSSVIFATRKGFVYSLPTGGGEPRLLAALEQDVDGPLTAYNDIVYIHTQDMTLQRVNARDGSVLTPISLSKTG